MKVVTRCLSVAMLFACATGQARGQEKVITQGTAGVRERAGFVDRSAVLGAATTDARRFSIVLTPSLVVAEDLLVYGASAGYVNRGALTSVPFQLKAGYRRIDPEGDGFNRFNGNLKIQLWNGMVMSRPTVIAAVADYTRTVDVSTRLEGTAAFEHALTTNGRLVAGFNASLVRLSPEGVDEDVEGFVPSLGLAYTLTEATELAADYEFDNDVSGDSSYSLNITQILSTKIRAVAGYAKEKTGFLTLVFIL